LPPLKFGAIGQTVFFKASPEDVYDALLDPKKHAEFTGSPATTSHDEGASFTAWGDYITGKNLELVKGKKIVQEWKTSEWPDGYPVSRLELILTAKNGGTQLEMIHSNVPAEQVSEYSGGWKSAYWEPLKEYLAKGEMKGETETMTMNGRRKKGDEKKKKTTAATSRSSPRSGSAMKKGGGRRRAPDRPIS
jgi:uncharacterized protein YndB with AHSA1/START domain